MFQAQIIQKEHLQTQRTLEDLCIELGFVPPNVLGPLLSELKGFPEADLSQMILDPFVVRQIPQEICVKWSLIALYQNDNEIGVALADVGDLAVRDKVSALFQGKSLKLFLASRKNILESIEQYYGFDREFESLLREIEQLSSAQQPVEDALHPTVRFVHALLLDAVRQGASDIHLEPEKSFVRLRYRCDGILKVIFAFHKSYWPQILARLKIVGDMDISENRHPQDGHLTYQLLGRQIDFRLASHPTIHGENLVIRILDKERSFLTLSQLGYSEKIADTVQKCLQTPEGLVIVTGPTSSGKTTSLYAFLNSIASDEINVMTLEEPVEYQIPFLRQTEVREKIGFHFAEGIKSILRQDPDVILVGEIRDTATAKMALRAAMTGHQVLTTLHTSDALSAVFRLMELGVPQALLAGNINCIIAQRLLRKLCTDCKKPIKAPSRVPCSSPTLIFEAQGCAACQQTGYQGRLAITEIIAFDQELNEQLFREENRLSASLMLKKRGHRTLWDDGLQRLFQGHTSLQELERVLGSVNIFLGDS